MARSQGTKGFDRTLARAKLVLLALVIMAFAIGGFGNLAENFIRLLIVIALFVGVLVSVLGMVCVVWRRDRQQNPDSSSQIPAGWLKTANEQSMKPAMWTAATVRQKLEEIDWYQFEKFCSALLEAEGFEVERKGGAGPDGGVDLIVQKNGKVTLVQCKHWKTWKVKEPVVRQMLGSMADFRVDHGAIYTLKGWTTPARAFAERHGIGLVDGDALAARAVKALDEESLAKTLRSDVHHCPKCEAAMVWRTGDFEAFWGCSHFPRCRGTLKHTGAR